MSDRLHPWFSGFLSTASLALTLMIAASGPLLAQSDQLETRLQKEADALKGQGFAPSDQIAIEPMGRADTRRYVLRLTQNITYAMIAGCADDCGHVEITIFDGERQQLSRSTKKANTAIFSGAPDKSGLYEVEITQPGCRKDLCQAGFMVMQQGGTVPQEGVIVAVNRSSPMLAAQARVTAPATTASTSPAPQRQAAAATSPPPAPLAAPEAEDAKPKPSPKAEAAKPEARREVAKAAPKSDTAKATPPKSSSAKAETVPLPRMVNMERRFDTEIRGSNYRRLTNTSLTACERACVSDQRCRAVEYYNDNQSCGFFDQWPALNPARGIHASVKRVAVR